MTKRRYKCPVCKQKSRERTSMKSWYCHNCKVSAVPIGADFKKLNEKLLMKGFKLSKYFEESWGWNLKKRRK